MTSRERNLGGQQGPSESMADLTYCSLPNGKDPGFGLTDRCKCVTYFLTSLNVMLSLIKWRRTISFWNHLRIKMIYIKADQLFLLFTIFLRPWHRQTIYIFSHVSAFTPSSLYYLLPAALLHYFTKHGSEHTQAGKNLKYTGSSHLFTAKERCLHLCHNFPDEFLYLIGLHQIYGSHRTSVIPFSEGQ